MREQNIYTNIKPHKRTPLTNPQIAFRSEKAYRPKPTGYHSVSSICEKHISPNSWTLPAWADPAGEAWYLDADDAQATECQDPKWGQYPSSKLFNFYMDRASKHCQET